MEAITGITSPNLTGQGRRIVAIMNAQQYSLHETQMSKLGIRQALLHIANSGDLQMDITGELPRLKTKTGPSMITYYISIMESGDTPEIDHKQLRNDLRHLTPESPLLTIPPLQHNID